MRKVAAIHPEASRVLAIIAELEQGIVPPVPIAMSRALMKKRSARLAADPPPVGTVINRTIDTPAGKVPVRFYSPADRKSTRLNSSHRT